VTGGEVAPALAEASGCHLSRTEVVFRLLMGGDLSDDVGDPDEEASS
jgi:hypothetical protein